MVIIIIIIIIIIIMFICSIAGNNKIQKVCRSSLLSGRNVRWPRRMLPPGEFTVSMPMLT